MSATSPASPRRVRGVTLSEGVVLFVVAVLIAVVAAPQAVQMARGTPSARARATVSTRAIFDATRANTRPVLAAPSLDLP